MPRSSSILYDTRFFVEHFYSKDRHILNLTRAEIDSHNHEKLVSVVTLHEFYRLNLERAGRPVAKLRTSMIVDGFSVVDINTEIAIDAAELRKRYSCPMGDGLLIATAKALNAICVTDDPHIREIKEIKSRWMV